MPADRTVLEHLLEGRDALVREVERLTAAIAELDAVIGQIGGAGRRVSTAVGSEDRLAALGSRTAETVNPRGEVESAAAVSDPAARADARVARRAPTRRSAPRKAANGGEAPKSIRLHVLEMLSEQDREFSLAEIIDGVHESGIQAHDDAVRSITIKLMKDGKVERVGRGQYRLARRGAARATQAIVTDRDEAPRTDGVTMTEEREAPQQPPEAPEPAAVTYTPPLNLGQPWDHS